MLRGLPETEGTDQGQGPDQGTGGGETEACQGLRSPYQGKWAVAPDVLAAPDDRLNVRPRPAMRGEDLSYLTPMRRALNRHNGLGIWAGQLGVPRQAIVVKPLRGGDGVAMLNPVILYRAEHLVDTQPEASLSYPGVQIQVPRATLIRVHYETPDWQARVEEFRNVTARVVQHLVDLMEGKCQVAAAWHLANDRK